MSEHTPLRRAEREALEVLAAPDAHAQVARLIVAARTSTATADTGHKSGCQEFPTGWLCVADCITVWHDKSADTGLRERVEAAEAALRWIADEPDIDNCAPDCMPRAACQRSDLGHMFCGFCLDCQEPRHHCGHTVATPASTEDRADNEGTR